MSYIKEVVNNTKGKIIFVGDFNIEYQKIKEIFQGFTLASEEVKTCSLTPFLKFFFWRDCDHIFVKGYNVREMGETIGNSDHKLLWADLD
jgi:endonuclease/exonuclease/phosphatase family metal-dependent hydrolase